jgi:RNA polymerase sigma factor (sigma-70 family)
MQLTPEILQQSHKTILYIVSKYPKYLRDDLIQEGYLGLMKAAQKYNPDKNVKLITYAVYWIKHYIWHYYQKNNVQTETFNEEDYFIEDSSYIRTYQKQLLDKLAVGVLQLDERSKDIITNRYLKEESIYLHILGKKYGISEERTRQIEVLALLKLRQILDK